MPLEFELDTGRRIEGTFYATRAFALKLTSGVGAMFGGMILASMGQAALGQLAMLVGIVMFAVMVVFQLVTLPVEFDASNRALAAIDDHDATEFLVG